MLNPTLSAIRSIPPKSSFRMNKAAIKVYPGRKRTKGRPNMLLTGVLLRVGLAQKVCIKG